MLMHFRKLGNLVKKVIEIFMTSCTCVNNLHVQTVKYLMNKMYLYV